MKLIPGHLIEIRALATDFTTEKRERKKEKREAESNPGPSKHNENIFRACCGAVALTTML